MPSSPRATVSLNTGEIYLGQSVKFPRSCIEINDDYFKRQLEILLKFDFMMAHLSLRWNFWFEIRKPTNNFKVGWLFGWLNSIPHRHENNVRKQTKIENISLISWLEIQTDQSCHRLNKGILCSFKREEHCYQYGDSSRQIKDLVQERVSFIRG